jgi:hypothetical protein
MSNFSCDQGRKKRPPALVKEEWDELFSVTDLFGLGEILSWTTSSTKKEGLNKFGTATKAYSPPLPS